MSDLVTRSSNKIALIRPMSSKPIYNTDLAAGSLMLPESRRIAEFLLTKPTDADWNHALRIENILQKKTPVTATRLGRLIRNRLASMPDEALQMIVQGDVELATQMLLLAAVKHSRLLGDFMREIMGEHLRSFRASFSPNDWELFLAECIQREASVSFWRKSTCDKLYQVITRILKEARYIDSTRQPRLHRVLLNPAVKAYMDRHHEHYAQACMEPCP